MMPEAKKKKKKTTRKRVKPRETQFTQMLASQNSMERG